jgi:hypothetical protein
LKYCCNYTICLDESALYAGVLITKSALPSVAVSAKIVPAD